MPRINIFRLCSPRVGRYSGQKSSHKPPKLRR